MDGGGPRPRGGRQARVGLFQGACGRRSGSPCALAKQAKAPAARRAHLGPRSACGQRVLRAAAARGRPGRGRADHHARPVPCAADRHARRHHEERPQLVEQPRGRAADRAHRPAVAVPAAHERPEHAGAGSRTANSPNGCATAACRGPAAACSVLLFTALGVGWAHQRERARRAAGRAGASTIATGWHQDRRHPHDAAHQGMHACKPEARLAMRSTRGINPYIGSTVWLQAHRQSEVKFNPAQDATGLQRFGNLSVGWILQVLGPLLVIVLGFNAFAGEREQGILRQTLELWASRRCACWRARRSRWRLRSRCCWCRPPWSPRWRWPGRRAGRTRRCAAAPRGLGPRAMRSTSAPSCSWCSACRRCAPPRARPSPCCSRCGWRRP